MVARLTKHAWGLLICGHEQQEEEKASKKPSRGCLEVLRWPKKRATVEGRLSGRILGRRLTNAPGSVLEASTPYFWQKVRAGIPQFCRRQGRAGTSSIIRTWTSCTMNKLPSASCPQDFTTKRLLLATPGSSSQPVLKQLTATSCLIFATCLSSRVKSHPYQAVALTRSPGAIPQSMRENLTAPALTFLKPSSSCVHTTRTGSRWLPWT